MHFKPDWFKSRTFWTGIAGGIVWLTAQLFGVDLSLDIQVWVEQLLPIVLLVLGITERANAAPVVVSE